MRWGRSSAKTSATVRWRSSGQGRSAARVAHHASAWSLRSSRSRNRRAAKKLERMKRMSRSTRPFSLPRAGATGARLEAVVGGELEQRGMEPDGVAAAFEHDAFHVVVEQDPRRAPECGERLDVAADEVGERSAEGEAYEGVSGVAQHQHERHQGTLGASDGELAEVRPVDLGLLAWKGAKPQIRFTGPARAQLRDAVAEVVGAAGVAPHLDHVEQPRGGERGEALQRLGDESHVGVELRGPTRAPALALDPGLAQHPLDGGVVDAELRGDGAHPPVLDEVVAQNLRPELVVDGHRTRRSVPGAPARASSRRRAPPLPADKLADRARTEVAVHRMGRLGGHRRARLAHRTLMTGECTTARGRSGTVMRHFLPTRAFAASASVAALALGMTVSAASRALIPASRRTHRFAPSEVAATRPAVLLAPITARADEHLAPATGTQKHPGIVHRSPRRGGLDDPQSPGNTALGAVRTCGSGRSLGRDRQVSGVRGCVGLLADSDLTATHERRHRRCTRRRRPVIGNIGSGRKQRHARREAQRRSRAALLRPGTVSSRRLFAEYPRPYAAVNTYRRAIR